MKIKSITKTKEIAKEKRQINAILNQVEKKSKSKKEFGSAALPSDANPIEKMKFAIVRDLLKFKKISGLTQTDIAKIIGVNKSRITEILHYRVSKFSLDTLIQYLFKLEGRVKETNDRIKKISDSFKYDIAI